MKKNVIGIPFSLTFERGRNRVDFDWMQTKWL